MNAAINLQELGIYGKGNFLVLRGRR